MGGARSSAPRLVLPKEKLDEAIDEAVRRLPAEARPGAAKQFHDAYREGEQAAVQALQQRQGSGADAKAGPARAAPQPEPAAKPAVTELPAVSRTINPMTGEEFEKLPRAGMVDPKRIRTAQDSADRVFRAQETDRPAKSILETTNELIGNPQKASEIDPIRIFELDGKVYTLDHRRLVAHRLADVPIRYRKATSAEVRAAQRPSRYSERGKLSTDSDGMEIRIRQ